MNNPIVNPDVLIINTEYDSKYCKLLCDYAYQHFDLEGFYGEYNVCPIAADRWELIHEDWRAARNMAEYKKKAGLSKKLNELLMFARGDARQDKITGKITYIRPPDIDLLQKVIFKMCDNNIRIEKDTGNLKRKGLKEARKDQFNKSDTITNEKAVQVAKDLLNKDNI